MDLIILTAYQGSILGPIAQLLGFIMNAIYEFISGTLGITNGSIGIAIIIFTIFVYLCLMPLTYRQQKFSALSRKIQPEQKKIQEKYKNKKDQASMMAQQEEMTALNDKYGINPAGSCVQLLIQMPILLALYRVFANVPAYLPSVKKVFDGLVDGIMSTDGYAKAMNNIYETSGIQIIGKVDFSTKDTSKMANYIVDVLYKLPESGWKLVTEGFPKLDSQVSSVQNTLEKINYLGPVNISERPWDMFMNAFDSRAIGLMIVALIIPAVNYGAQVLAMSMIPMNSDDPTAKQMQSMNKFMPMMSLFFTFVTPAGLGVYWAVGAVIRCIQQYILNRHFENIDLDEIVEKNKEKAAKKAEKRGLRQQQITNMATMDTKRRGMSEKAAVSETKEADIEKANSIRANAKPGSMASKANLVKKYNEKGGKK